MRPNLSSWRLSRAHSRNVQVMILLKRGTLRVTLRAASQRGSCRRLPLVTLFELAQMLLDLTEGCRVDNEVSLGRQVFDLAKCAHDAFEERGMGSEEAG